MDLKLLNINVWHGLYVRSIWRVEHLQPEEVKERRIQGLIAAIREHDPDVVTLQECFPQPAQGRRIAAELGLEEVSQVSNAGVRLFGTGYPFGIDTGEGSSILARKGLGLRYRGRKSLSGLGFTSSRLSLQFADKRMALAAEVVVGGKPLLVVTCHVRYEWGTEAELDRAWQALAARGAVAGELPAELRKSVRANMARRDAELEVLSSWIADFQAQGVPVVLLGDLNLDDEAEQTRAFAAKLGLTSTLPLAGETKRTWDPARNPNIALSSSPTYVDGEKKDVPSLVVAYHDELAQRPDHVFLGRALTEDACRSSRVVLDEPRDGIFPSDHFGILATVRIGG